MLQRGRSPGIEESHLSEQIKAICQISEPFPPVFDPQNYDAQTFARYITASNNRRKYICGELGSFGWTAQRDLPFKFNPSGNTQVHRRERYSGTNTIIAWDGSNFSSPPLGLYCAHTDYCAGVGAIDNASGCAGIISLARAISLMEEMRKKVWFVLFDQEENDRCGSRDFAEWVLRTYDDPAETILAAVNLDGIGEGRDIVISNGSTTQTLCSQVHERLRHHLTNACDALSLDLPYWRPLESDIASLKGQVVNATLLISSLDIIGSTQDQRRQELRNLRAHTAQDTPGHVCIDSVAQATRLALNLMELVLDSE